MSTTALDPPEVVDQEAPYGRNPKTGAPYKRPKEERDRLAANLAAGREAKAARAAATGRGTAATQATRSKRSSGPADPYKGNPVARDVAGLLALVAMPLGIVGARTQSVPLLADAAAVAKATPPIAFAVSELAEDNERLREFVENIGKASPYAALIGAMIPLAAQIGANHGWLPIAPEFGIVDPGDLAMEVIGDAANAQRLAEQERQSWADQSDPPDVRGPDGVHAL